MNPLARLSFRHLPFAAAAALALTAGHAEAKDCAPDEKVSVFVRAPAAPPVVTVSARWGGWRDEHGTFHAYQSARHAEEHRALQWEHRRRHEELEAQRDRFYRRWGHDWRRVARFERRHAERVRDLHRDLRGTHRALHVEHDLDHEDYHADRDRRRGDGHHDHDHDHGDHGRDRWASRR